MALTWSQALSWRTQRQLLDPVGRTSVAEVVRRLGAVLATDDSAAELAVGARRQDGRRADVTLAFEQGEIIKVFAFRGGMHYLSPDDGGAYLALRCAGRQWELPSWQEYYRLRPDDWPDFRRTVRDSLSDGPLTVSELGEAVTGQPAYRHLRAVFDEGAGTLIKPLTWQGDIGFGPRRQGRQTFQRLDGNPRWTGVWGLEEAGVYAVVAYLRSYGPATSDHVHYWLGSGLSAGRKRVQSWLASLGDRLVEVDVDGETAYVMRDDLDDLMETEAAETVRLLPGHDQWVIGPGTKDSHIVPVAHRTAVTRKANLVISGGVVSGTWAVSGDEVEVMWFPESVDLPQAALEHEVLRLGRTLGRSLTAVIDPT